MLKSITQTTARHRRSARLLARRLRRDKQGTTAIEFAIVALPFLLFCGAILGYGIYFFTATALEFSVETAARKIRTGQSTATASTAGLTRAQFKNEICNASAGASSFIDCSRLKVHIQSSAAWSGITPTPCLSSGSLAASAGADGDAVSGSGNAGGGASQAVVITVCYEWKLAKAMPFLMLSNMGNGSSVIQAVATFRSEPYQ